MVFYLLDEASQLMGQLLFLLSYLPKFNDGLLILLIYPDFIFTNEGEVFVKLLSTRCEYLSDLVM
jgi:hypothetical protein